MPTRFPHLQFLAAVSTPYVGSGRGSESQETADNRKQLRKHGRKLTSQLNNIQQIWERELEAAREEGLVTADSETIPLFLQLDPKLYSIDEFINERTWGVEIIAEQENGFVIAASTSDGLAKLVRRLERMQATSGNPMVGMAKLWNIETRDRSLEDVLGESLFERWETLDNELECWVDVSLNIGMHMPGAPPSTDSPEYASWTADITRYDELSEERQNQLILVVESNGGSIESDFSSLGDTADCRVKISGLGIKNIFFYLPYIWEINEADVADELRIQESRVYTEYSVEILPPAPNAPRVCVIDSGMQSGHRLLSPAMASSRSYVIRDSSTADSVANGGHGTRVGGAVLYPERIPRTGTYQPIAWLQNARILEGPLGLINKSMHLPTLMRRIVEEHLPTRLYNLSVAARTPHLPVHMSAWAAAIDQLSYEHDVLFVVSAGNIERDASAPRRMGLMQHLASKAYPHYLGDAISGIANPAQSCQAITVGSVCYDRISTPTHWSFGERGRPSAFSRSGLGIWNMVKPDVVEYGGDSVQTAAGTIITMPDASPELISSTSNGTAVSRDVVGTSFATPKVTHIAAALQSLFPNSRTLLYRALIAQSAHWPDYAEYDTIENKFFHFRTLGYGIPSLERATENTESRITFITEGSVQAKYAKIYAINIPGVGTPGDDTDYRLEVTLSYVARPRRTRRRLHSYLSTRLTWQMARLGESVEAFRMRLQRAAALEQDDSAVNGAGIKWQLGRRSNHYVPGLKVQDSTLQKDWGIVKGYNLPSNKLVFAVTAHEGWEKKPELVPFAFAVTLTSLDGKRIYEQIELANNIELEGPSGF
jgi:hypothetical protein